MVILALIFKCVPYNVWKLASLVSGSQERNEEPAAGFSKRVRAFIMILAKQI
jgi:hypothetical protein